MCVVSMIGDHYSEKWKDLYSTIYPHDPAYPTKLSISREEFEALKKDVEECKKLLKKAKAYDEANNEPDCEIEAKMEILRKMAEFVNIDLDDVISKHVKSAAPAAG